MSGVYEFSLLTEFDEELHDRTLRAEGYAEGRAEFMAKLISLFVELNHSGSATKEGILCRFALSDEEVEQLDEALASSPCAS